MTAGKISRGIYLVTEHERLTFSELLAITESVMPTGVAALQYRNKLGVYAQKLAEASRLQQLCKKFQVPFIINDDIALAIELDADGVHLGRDDATVLNARKLVGKAMQIGISCYNDIGRAD